MKRTYNFPGGIAINNFFSENSCNLLKTALSEADFVPALVARYNVNELVRVEHDPLRSTALVSKDFIFDESVFNLEEITQAISKIIKDRFNIKISSFSKYGVSKYPKGSKLSPHADTGVYNTNRLITCIMYLDTAEKGGNLTFPQVNVELNVEIGMLVCFYSELIHEVTEIVSGERIAIVLFGE